MFITYQYTRPLRYTYKVSKLQHIVFVAALLFISLVPLSASALGLSFGGRIVAIYPTCLNGGIWVAISPAGPHQPFYIWTPATLTYSAGPPKSIGQQILGVADIPYVCVVSWYPYVQLVGERIQFMGSSPTL